MTTLLKLAEKQAPEKLPMVRSCIQDLLDGAIDPEAFTKRLHTLYKSQPHTSLVPFFKVNTFFHFDEMFYIYILLVSITTHATNRKK